MAENSGYFKFPRELLSNPLFKDLSFEYRHIFLTILANVAYVPITLSDHGKLIDLKPGQLMTTYRQLVKLCDEKGIDVPKLQRALRKFENLGFSRQETIHTKTIITITFPMICNLFVETNDTRNDTTSIQDRYIKEERKERKEEYLRATSSSSSLSSSECKIISLSNESDAAMPLFEESEDSNPVEASESTSDNHRSAIDSQNLKENKKNICQEKKPKLRQLPSPKIEKISFRENVFLTQKEHDTLLEIHGQVLLDQMYNILDSYKGSSGKKYASDYYVMKEGGWVLKKVREEITSQPKKEKSVEEIEKIKAYSVKFRATNFEKLRRKGIYFEVFSEYIHIGNDKIYFKDFKFEELIGHSLRKLNFFDMAHKMQTV